MKETVDTAPPRISNMTFPELVTFATALGNKIDTLWHRIIYIHVGMVAVVIFLANAPGDRVVARLAVFAFYTFNVFVTFVNLNEPMAGSMLQSTISGNSDSAILPVPSKAGCRRVTYTNSTRLRAIVLFLFWLSVAFLVLSPMAPGSDMMPHERVQTILGISPPRR